MLYNIFPNFTLPFSPFFYLQLQCTVLCIVKDVVSKKERNQKQEMAKLHEHMHELSCNDNLNTFLSALYSVGCDPRTHYR